MVRFAFVFPCTEQWYGNYSSLVTTLIASEFVGKSGMLLTENKKGARIYSKVFSGVVDC